MIWRVGWIASGWFEENDVLHQDDMKNMMNSNLSSNHTYAKWLPRQGIESIRSPNQQGRPLPSLLFIRLLKYGPKCWVVYWLLGIGWFHAHNSWTIQIQNLERTSLRRLNPAPRKSKSQTPQPGPSKEQVSDASTRPLKRTSLRRLNPAPRMTWSIQESVQNRKTHSSHSKDQRFWDQISS